MRYNISAYRALLVLVMLLNIGCNLERNLTDYQDGDISTKSFRMITVEPYFLQRQRVAKPLEVWGDPTLLNLHSLNRASSDSFFYWEEELVYTYLNDTTLLSLRTEAVDFTFGEYITRFIAPGIENHPDYSEFVSRHPLGEVKSILYEGLTTSFYGINNELIKEFESDGLLEEKYQSIADSIMSGVYPDSALSRGVSEKQTLNALSFDITGGEIGSTISFQDNCRILTGTVDGHITKISKTVITDSGVEIHNLSSIGIKNGGEKYIPRLIAIEKIY